MMKSKTLLIITIILSVLVCVIVGSYVYFRMLTSDEAIKAKITKALDDNIGGQLSIGKTHFDPFRGLEVDNVKYNGKAPGNLRINAEKIIIHHSPLALLRGELLIDSITIISPEIFAIRDKEVVWKYLFGIKALLDKKNIGSPTDLLRGGIAVKNARIHISDEKVFKNGVLNVENVDMILQPFGGSLRDINIKGSVKGGFWEGFEFNADANFTTPELKIVTQLRDKFMTEDLMKEVPGVGEKLWKAYSSTGKFNLTSVLNFNGKDNVRTKDSNVAVNITDAEMTYMRWPLLIKHVNGIIELTRGGIYLKSLKGHIQNEGQEPLGEIDAFFGRGNSKKNVKLKISDINITESLMKIIPDLGEKVWIDYGPKGKIDISLTYESNEDKSEIVYSVEATCKGLEANIPGFPFRMRNIVGLVRMDGENVYFENMSGNLLNGNKSNHVTFNGVVSMKSKESKFTALIPNLDLTEEIIKGLPGRGEEVWSKYKPMGQMDLTVEYTGRKDKEGKSVANYSIEAVCKGVEVRYPNTPYILTDIVGLIEVDGENMYFKNISGNLITGTKANRTTLDGFINLKSKESNFTLSVPNLDLTEDIIKSIPESGEDIWSKYRPTGQVDLTINYAGHEDSSNDHYLITADCKGNEVVYTKLPMKVSDIIGRVVIDKDNIQFKNLRGYVVSDNHFSRTICNGVLGIKNKNNNLIFSVFDLKVTEDLLDKLPALSQNDLFRIGTDGWVDVTLNYKSEDTSSKSKYSTDIDVNDCKIMFAKRPLYMSGIDARVNIENETLTSRNFSGICNGGKVNGSIKADNMSLNGEYIGELKFSGIDLNRLLEQLSEIPQELTGTCEGSIKFHGKGKGLENLIAEGQLKIRDSYISKVPALLSILNLLNLSLPVKETFHSADIKYSVKDNIINIEELEVLSNSIELGCVGTIDFDGVLDLTIVIGFNQETFSQIPLIGHLMDYVVGGVRRKLTKVQMTGTLSKPQSTMIALKPFTQPIKSIFGLLARNKEHDDKTTSDDIVLEDIE